MKKKFIAMFLLFTFATFIFTNASVKAESMEKWNSTGMRVTQPRGNGER